MTKKECYEAMYRIWIQLANDPKLKKRNIPEASEYLGNCPACEYALLKRSLPISCEIVCIMKSLWPKGCCIASNAYWKYKESEGYDRCFFALIIAEEARLLGESCK